MEQSYVMLGSYIIGKNFPFVKCLGLPWLLHRPCLLSSLCYDSPGTGLPLFAAAAFYQMVLSNSAMLPAGCVGYLSLAATFS